MRFLLVAAACLAFCTPSAVFAHRLIEAEEAVSVARSDMTVIPAIEWNRIRQRPGSSAERWTLDGELLNDVLFFAEIEDGDTLFRDRDRRNNPLPEFSSSMLLIDVPDFYGSSLRIAKGAVTFDVGSVEPVQFLGRPGVLFDFHTLGGDDLLRKGRAIATLIEGELFMMAYEAPEIFFYERNLQDFEQLVESAYLD